MICYIAKRESDGFLDHRYISTKPIDVSGSGWVLVPVEIRECDEKRKRLEDAAGDLLATCKAARKFACKCVDERFNLECATVVELLNEAIAKAEGE